MNGGAAARRRGIRFEQQVARLLGTSTTRNTRPGVHDDAGDIHHDKWTIECKDHTTWRIRQWFSDLEAKADDRTPVLIVKRRRRPVGDALVFQRLNNFYDDTHRRLSGIDARPAVVRNTRWAVAAWFAELETAAGDMIPILTVTDSDDHRRALTVTRLNDWIHLTTN